MKPLPFPDPDRIVRVLEAPTPTARNGITTLNFLDWKRLSTSFEALSAIRGLSVALTGEGEPSRLNGTLVSADYFEVFGVEAGGRPHVPPARRGQPGAAPVVVAEPRGLAGRGSAATPTFSIVRSCSTASPIK